MFLSTLRPEKTQHAHGGRFHPDMEAIIADGRAAGSEQKEKLPDGKISPGQKGACAASLRAERLRPLAR